MNAGCLKPINHRHPRRLHAAPAYPARRGGRQCGNQSQHVTNAMFGALKALAAARDDEQPHLRQRHLPVLRDDLLRRAGAGPGFDGTAGVHTHMTNSRLTDPEILELRFPVVLEDFHIA
jgi:5-oxoprolinase (ATP-hydrolysing)